MAKPKEPTYEEIRNQRLEENRKRMEDLNLVKLAQAVTSKSSPMKQVKPRSSRKETPLTEIRRSSRVACLPTPDYKEVVSIVGLEKRRRYSSNRTDLANRVYASDEARLDATERAEEFESKLERGAPSFVKPMLQSHVTGGFWLGLPRSFCKRNLPKRDETITLVDESGDEWPTVYLSEKNGLSGGWRGFALAHELVDGDALVFELVKPKEFKVYIIKVNN